VTRRKRLAAERDEAAALIAGWSPSTSRRRWRPRLRQGRVRVGLSRLQRLSSTVLVLGVVCLLVIEGLHLNRPALLVAAILFAIALLGVAFRARIELTPTTLGLRSAISRTRTVRLSAVLDIDATDRGELSILLPGEAPFLVRAPRRRWITRDRSFEDKATFIRTWWLENRATTPARSAAAEVFGSAGWAFPMGNTADADGIADTDAEPVRVAGGLATRRPFSFPTMVTVFVLAMVFGYLVVGRDIVVLAVALLVLLRFGRDPGRPLALAGFVLLVVAAVATIVQEFPPEVNLAYATRRTIAAETGAIVGVFLVLAIIIFSVTERSPEPAPRRRRRGTVRCELAALVAVLARPARVIVPIGLIAAVAVAIRALGLPAALSPQYNVLIDNLRLGSGYQLGAPSILGGEAVGTAGRADAFPPLSPVIVAYSPLGPGLALMLVSLGIVVLVGWQATRRWGRASGLMAAAVAAVLPPLWSPQLPVQLAALAVLGGVAFAEPARLSPWRAAAGGVCLGLAFLARPDAIAALVVVVAWIMLSRRGVARAQAGAGELAALIGAAIVVMAPWLNFVWTEFGLPWPMASLAATLDDPSSAPRLDATMATTAAVIPALALVLVFFLSRARRDLRLALLPFFVLPILCLTLSVTGLSARDPLSWSAPLVAVVLGMWLASIARGLFGAALDEHADLDQQDEQDGRPELELAPEHAVVELTPGRFPGSFDRDNPLIDPEPDEDHLFL
jgi:hypothetical protein